MECDGSELKFLLRLLDDDSPTVRNAVKRRLASYGPNLRAVMDAETPDIPFSLREEALELQRVQERDEFLETWSRWLKKPSGPEKLEHGLILLSAHLSPSPDCSAKIRQDLDELAAGFLERFPRPDFRNLAAFLFSNGRFRGDAERYYHPHNSILAEVLERRRGNPISLACVYILVGRRLGVDIGGCNYPAHFLARAFSRADGQLYLIDCFNEGKVIVSDDLIRHHPLASHEVKDVVWREARAEVIISRVLRNLENSLGQNNLPHEQAFMRSLRRTIVEDAA